jgi:hypothetical protein
MNVTGKCHCGALAYEADVDPERVVICHCADCQKLTGSAYRVSIPTTNEQFVMLRGAPVVYVKTADSGARRAQAFCPHCGSPLYTYDVDHPRDIGLRVGCIEQRQALPPAKQVWCQSALPWSMDVHDLPCSARE